MRGTSNIWLKHDVRAKKACIDTSHTAPSQVQHKAYPACFSSITQLDFSASEMGNTKDKQQLKNKSNQPASVYAYCMFHTNSSCF